MWQEILSSFGIIFVGLIFYVTGPFIVNWLMSHVFVTAYQRTLHKKDLEKRQKTLSALFSNVWRIIIVLITAYGVFVQFFDYKMLAPLFASAGIIGVALGFGAQSLVKDFLSGVFIISENQFRVGDIIEIEGFGGTVERIGVRSTVIRDADGNVLARDLLCTVGGELLIAAADTRITRDFHSHLARRDDASAAHA